MSAGVALRDAKSTGRTLHCNDVGRSCLKLLAKNSIVSRVSELKMQNDDTKIEECIL